MFALTGWMIQRYAASVGQHSIEEEVRTSLQAYESLWGARVHNLASVSRIISSMSDVRSAFMTHDRATIRDTAQQLWSQVSEQMPVSWCSIRQARRLLHSAEIPNFDKRRSHGLGDEALPEPELRLHQARIASLLRVFTPVYVQAANGQGLLNVLLVAFDINDSLAQALKKSTHGSDFAFIGSDVVFASTLPMATARNSGPGQNSANRIRESICTAPITCSSGPGLKTRPGIR